MGSPYTTVPTEQSVNECKRAAGPAASFHTARTNTAVNDKGRFHFSSVFSLFQLFEFTLIPQIISNDWEMLSKQVLNLSVFSLDQTDVRTYKPSRHPLNQTSVSLAVPWLGAQVAADPRLSLGMALRPAPHRTASSSSHSTPSSNLELAPDPFFI